MTHAPPTSFLHLINFLPVSLQLWRAAVKNGRGLWKDTSSLTCVCAQECEWRDFNLCTGVSLGVTLAPPGLMLMGLRVVGLC